MAKPQQKIFLEADDGLDVVLHYVKTSKAKLIELHIPRESVLRSSPDNFHTIKREVSQAGKKMLIESVDPYIEELASLAGIDSLNPIFGKNERLISDIIPKSSRRAPEARYMPVEEKLSSFTKEIPRRPIKKRRSSSRVRQLVLPLVLILIVLGGVIVGVRVLPRATMLIVLEKTPLTFEKQVAVKSDVYEVEIEDDGIVLPGEVLSAIRNIEMQFPANSEQIVERKAKGELYIYNEFSSTPQVLLETTRFLLPDGKIYRLDKRVTVPGAEVVEGTLTPSRIKVAVTASSAGEAYNIDPDLDTKWTIPGFKEQELMGHYEGFYAKPVGPMTGGYVGSLFIPTDEDKTKAREAVETALRDALTSQMLVVESPELILVKGAEYFAITNEEIKETIDEEGMFSFFASAEMKRVVFEENTFIESLLASLVSPLDYDFRVVESELHYDEVKIDWETGTLAFVTKGSFVVEPKVDSDSLRAQLLRQEESMIKSIIFNIPGLEKANVSLWPFWVKRVPDNPKKVNIEFQ